KAAFEDKLLNVELLEHHKLLILEADLASELLGLEQETYRQIQTTVTAIIHNAWQVNFNLTLPSFAPSLKATRNLLDLASSSTTPSGLPRFLFTSSVSAAGFGYSGEPLREDYISLEHGMENIGYGRSKLVAEKLLESARASSLEACVVRLDRSVILPPVIHCAHPRPARWLDMIEMFAEVLNLRTPSGAKLNIVPFGEWNDKVTKAASTFTGLEDQKYKKFPSTKIQDVFDGMIQSMHGMWPQDNGSYAEAGGTAFLDMTEAQQLSSILRDAPRLSQAYVERWVTYWEGKGCICLNAKI
ncbi:hypothetical protein FRC06_006119, partial [Ceratobasidium sp. 370]